MSEFGPQGAELLKLLKDKVDTLYNSLSDIYTRLDKLENKNPSEYAGNISQVNDNTMQYSYEKKDLGKPPSLGQINLYKRLFNAEPPQDMTSAQIWKILNEETEKRKA